MELYHLHDADRQFAVAAIVYGEMTLASIAHSRGTDKPLAPGRGPGEDRGSMGARSRLKFKLIMPPYRRQHSNTVFMRLMSEIATPFPAGAVAYPVPGVPYIYPTGMT